MLQEYSCEIFSFICQLETHNSVETHTSSNYRPQIVMHWSSLCQSNINLVSNASITVFSLTEGLRICMSNFFFFINIKNSIPILSNNGNKKPPKFFVTKYINLKQSQSKYLVKCIFQNLLYMAVTRIFSTSVKAVVGRFLDEIYILNLFKLLL